MILPDGWPVLILMGALGAVVKDILKDNEFHRTIKMEFRHKVAKNLVGELTGSIERAVNLFKQDPTLRAKLILAIEQFISDYEKGDCQTPKK